MSSLLYKLIITRPYSWISIILVGLLANVVVTKNFIININLITDIFVAILSWFIAIFIVEFFHKKIDKREPISPLLPILLIIILSFILLYRNAFTMLFLLIIIVTDLAYASKVKKWFLSSFSFMLRGVLEVCIFLIILFSHSFYSINEVLPLILAIYFLTNSRNLIGDIRDVKFDKFTFPKKYGIKTSYVVSFILILFSIIMINNLAVTTPLIIYLFILIFLRDAYLLHRIFVLTTTFFLMNHIMFLLRINLIFTNILFIAVLLNFTYPLVPRKSNPKTYP